MKSKLFARLKNIVIILLLAAAVFFCTQQYLAQIEENSRQTAELQIVNLSHQMAGTVEAVVTAAKQSMQSLAAGLSALNDFQPQKAAELVDGLAEKTLFDRIWVGGTDGAMYCCNGAVLSDVTDMEYFKEALKGNSGINEPIVSRIDGKDVIIVYAPVVIAGRAEGIAAGTVMAEVIGQKVEYSGDGMSTYILHNNGDIIYRPAQDILFNGSDHISKAGWEIDNLDIKEMERQSGLGNEGCFYFDRDGAAYTAFYCPVEDSGWYVLTVMDNGYQNRSSAVIAKQGMWFLVKLLVIFGIVLIWFYMFMRRSKNKTEKANHELALNFAKYKLAMEQSDSIVFEYSRETDAIIFDCDETFSDNFPCRIDGVLSGDVSQYISAQEHKRLKEFLLSVLENKSGSIELYFIQKNGIMGWNLLSARSEQNIVVGILKDIDPIKRTQKRLEQETQYRRAIIYKTLFTARFILGEEHISVSYISDVFKNDYYPPENYLCGKPSEFILSVDDISKSLQPEQQRAAARCGSSIVSQCRFKKKDGEFIWIRLTVFPFEDADGILGGIIYAEDINKDVLSTQSLKEKAERDSLTGLYNRAAAQERINPVLASIKPGTAAFMFMDVDDLKHTNDTLGHAAGDRLLMDIAMNIDRFRSKDTVCRISGDEFGVFMNDVSCQTAWQRLQEIKYDLAKVGISISIGIAMNEQGDTFNDITSRADGEMYRDKKCARDGAEKNNNV